MSTALAVCHGSFGRIPVYRPAFPMGTHAHREGRLTFHLGAPPAIVTISNVPHLVDETAGLAINLPVVNCLTSDVRVPEGPFGEFPKYYSAREAREVIEIDTVTHRRDPIYHTIIPAEMEHLPLGAVMCEPIILAHQQRTFPKASLQT